MGLFDSLLKAVESGGIEKTLLGAIDKLESSLEKVEQSAEKIADKPEQLLKAAEIKQKQLDERVDVLKARTGRTMDILRHNDG